MKAHAMDYIGGLRSDPSIEHFTMSLLHARGLPGWDDLLIYARSIHPDVLDPMRLARITEWEKPTTGDSTAFPEFSPVSIESIVSNGMMSGTARVEGSPLLINGRMDFNKANHYCATRIAWDHFKLIRDWRNGDCRPRENDGRQHDDWIPGIEHIVDILRWSDSVLMGERHALPGEWIRHFNAIRHTAYDLSRTAHGDTRLMAHLAGIACDMVYESWTAADRFYPDSIMRVASHMLGTKDSKIIPELWGHVTEGDDYDSYRKEAAILYTSHMIDAELKGLFRGKYG